MKHSLNSERCPHVLFVGVVLFCLPILFFAHLPERSSGRSGGQLQRTFSNFSLFSGGVLGHFGEVLLIFAHVSGHGRTGGLPGLILSNVRSLCVINWTNCSY